MKRNIAIILSGCGVSDGSEIHEAVMTMLAIDKQGAIYTLFAPNKPQHHVIHHITQKEMPESRNVLTEAARIARGHIFPLSQFDASQFDALVLPGGSGAVKNLSDYAFCGTACSVDMEVADAIRAMHNLHKPIGGLCIAPVVIAKTLGNGVKVTIGNNAYIGNQLKEMGAEHCEAALGEVVIDEKNKVVTTPCYMYAEATIGDICDSAESLVKCVLKLI